MQDEYRSKDIQRIAKVSKDKLVHWTRIGIIEPIQNAEGRGARRVYSYRNLIEAMICRELNQFHVETQTLRVVIGYLDAPLWPPDKSKYTFWEVLEKQHARVLDVHPFLIIKPDLSSNMPAINITLSEKTGVTIYLERFNRAMVINIKKLVEEADQG